MRVRFLAFGALLVLASPVRAQTPKAGDQNRHLRIDSPRDGAVVATTSSSSAGEITAIRSGKTAVVAWYGPRDRGVKVSVLVEVR